MTVREIGAIVIEEIGLAMALSSYDLSHTSDIEYWVGCAALSYGDITRDGEFN